MVILGVCVKLSAATLVQREMYCIYVFIGPQGECCFAFGIFRIIWLFVVQL